MPEFLFLKCMYDPGVGEPKITSISASHIVCFEPDDINPEITLVCMLGAAKPIRVCSSYDEFVEAFSGLLGAEDEG